VDDVLDKSLEGVCHRTGHFQVCLKLVRLPLLELPVMIDALDGEDWDEHRKEQQAESSSNRGAGPGK